MAHQATNTVTGRSDHLFNKNGDREDVRTRREFEDGQPDLRGGARQERSFVGVIRCSDKEHGEDHLCRSSVSATDAGRLWTFSWIPSIGWSCP